MDPLSLVMFGLIAVLIFFMFRNGRKRQQAQQEMQNNLRPGAQVMLQSGIFATVESVDEEENRVTIRSGDSTLVVHRNAVGQILVPADAPAESSDIAPDDDPEFGERVDEAKNGAAAEAAADDVVLDGDAAVEAEEQLDADDAAGDADENEKPKA